MITNATSGLSPDNPNIENPAINFEMAASKINTIHQNAIKNLPPELQQSMQKSIDAAKFFEDPMVKKQLFTKTIKMWSDNSFDSKTRRVKDYVDENTATALLCPPVAVGGSIVGCAVLGAATGAGIGFAVAGPPGIPPGAVIGGSVGAAIGFVSSTTAAIVCVRSDYIQWKRSHRREDMLPVLFKIYENHPDLNFTCPLTLSLFEDPVFTPSGVAYEKAAILAELEKNNNKIKDPCDERTTITPKDLYTDFAMIGAILSALEIIAKEDLEKLRLNKELDLDSDVYKALKSTIRDLNDQIKQCESQGKKVIDYLWDKKRINARACKAYRARLDQLLRD